MLRLRFDIQLTTFNLVAEITLADEILALCGPSGAGKTTILNCIAGLAQPAAGLLELNGRTLFSSANAIDTEPGRRNIGYVFQDHALFPHMTVERNVAYGLAGGHKAAHNKTRVAKILESMNISHLGNRFPSQLSGGEQQRVALARALVTEPELLLLDEPLSALDPDTRLQLQSGLKALHQQWRIPFILVTHNRQEADILGDCFAGVSIRDNEHRFVYKKSSDRPSRFTHLPTRHLTVPAVCHSPI